MTPSQWVQLVSDTGLQWASVFKNNGTPTTTAQLGATVYLEEQRQKNNTLLILGGLAVAAFVFARK